MQMSQVCSSQVTSSGEWYGCNCLSWEIIRGVCWSQRGGQYPLECMDLQRSGYQKENIYRFCWKEDIWHHERRENEHGVGAKCPNTQWKSWFQERQQTIFLVFSLLFLNLLSSEADLNNACLDFPKSSCCYCFSCQPVICPWLQCREALRRWGSIRLMMLLTWLGYIIIHFLDLPSHSISLHLYFKLKRIEKTLKSDSSPILLFKSSENHQKAGGTPWCRQWVKFVSRS